MNRHFKLVRHEPILDKFAAMLAERWGESWEALSEAVRDYYRAALLEGGAKKEQVAALPAAPAPQDVP